LLDAVVVAEDEDVGVTPAGALVVTRRRRSGGRLAG
jgi:hypothetical protein